MSHVGSCFCGAITLEVTGSPEAMGYCHCFSCRSWSGGPVNAFSLWKPQAVRIASGAEHVATFEKTAQLKIALKPSSSQTTGERAEGAFLTDQQLSELNSIPKIGPLQQNQPCRVI